MNVGNHIRHALDACDSHEHELAMMNACAAMSSTAQRWAPKSATNRQAFTNFLRANYEVLGPMALRGLNVAAQRFPLNITSSLGQGEWPDLADVIYTVHRNAHMHGDEVKLGYELTERVDGPVSQCQIDIENRTIHLPWNVIPGLCATAILSELNVGQQVPAGYHLTWGFPAMRFEVNEWWGRKHDFLDKLATQPSASATIDFSHVV